MLIKLTDIGGDVIVVNLDQVFSIAPHGENTILRFDDEEWVAVEETIGTILGMIKKGETYK